MSEVGQPGGGGRRAPVVASAQDVVTSDSTGKGKPAKEMESVGREEVCVGFAGGWRSRTPSQPRAPVSFPPRTWKLRSDREGKSSKVRSRTAVNGPKRCDRIWQELPAARSDRVEHARSAHRLRRDTVAGYRAGQLAEKRTLAKEIVRSRRAVNRLHENKAQLNSVSMHLGEIVATWELACCEVTLPSAHFFGHFVAVRLGSFDDIPWPSDRKLRHFDRNQRRELDRCEAKRELVAVKVLSPYRALLRLCSHDDLPSCWIGSYNALIGSNNVSSLTVKVTFSLPSTFSAKSRNSAEPRDLVNSGFNMKRGNFSSPTALICCEIWLLHFRLFDWIKHKSCLNHA
ncbi:hypothetical protein M5K25_022073 [Dendrobium thyrsiflorum]|uniref:Uncharacterized protein n=1 Tax=Dendrobium thyrsiflorum TaxID=117978 RepID=A0ABD0U5M4_DENTH